MNLDTFTQLAAKRYACRGFNHTPVPRTLIEQVMEAVRLAPSARNQQPWTFHIVTEPEMLQKLQSAYSREWFATAQAVIVAVGNHNEAWHRDYDNKDATDIDLAIAIDHLTLAATAAGLGTCWICAFDAPAVISALNLAEGEEPIALIPIGYPAAEPVTKRRKPLQDIIRWR